MTTIEKIRAIAKLLEVRPSNLATVVVKLMTKAEGELGMPPVSARTRKFSRRCRMERSATLRIWAINQARAAGSRYLTRHRSRRGRGRWLPDLAGASRLAAGRSPGGSEP